MLRFVQSTLLITWELKQSHASVAAPDDCPYVLPSKTIHVVKKGSEKDTKSGYGHYFNFDYSLKKMWCIYLRKLVLQEG